MLEEIERLVPIGSIIRGINSRSLAVVLGGYVVDIDNPDAILCSARYIEGTDKGLVIKKYFLAIFFDGRYKLAVDIINNGRFTVICKELK
jgi:hypothetical protein